MMWPSQDGQWLLYAVLDSGQSYRLDYVDYLTDRSQAASVHFAVVNGSLFLIKDIKMIELHNQPGGALPHIQLQLLHLETDSETTLGSFHDKLKATQSLFRNEIDTFYFYLGIGSSFKSSGWTRPAF